MSNWIYLGIGLGGAFILVGVVLLITFRREKKYSNPIELRARDTEVMITQRMHKMNKRIQHLDKEVTKYFVAKENQDLTIKKDKNSKDGIQESIDEKKEEIRVLIGDIKDLEEYRNEINKKVKKKNENWEKEVEELLDFVKEKLKYRFT